VLIQLAAPAQVQAANTGSISSVEPTSLLQGQTVMLTIRGSNLPVGSVVVEFFPQQIAVVGILASSADELTVQLKVPQMAPPGQYNIIVYNQLGDEAFGPALITVGSTVSAPIFRSYDPKVIAEASQAFAVVLGCEALAPDVVSHLHMQWSIDGTELTGLESTFSYSGPETAVCSVSGPIPSGRLRGRVYFDSSPIYQLDLQVAGTRPDIVGHSPAVCESSPAGLALRLLGTGFQAPLLPRLKVRVTDNAQKDYPGELLLTDSATIAARFPLVTAAGEYSLQVESEGAVVYTGRVQINARPEPEAPPVPPVAPTPEPDPLPAQPPSALPAQEPLADPLAGNSDATQTPPLVEPGSGTAEPPAAQIDDSEKMGTATQKISVSPTEFPPGMNPIRLSVRGMATIAMPPEQVEIRVLLGTAECERVFSSAGPDALVFVFAPPQGGWKEGESGVVTIKNLPGGAYVQPFMVVSTGSSALPAQSVAQPKTTADPAQNTRLVDPHEQTVIDTQGFSLLIEPSGEPLSLADWARLSLHSDNLLLNANAGKFNVIALARPQGAKQRVELQFRRDEKLLDDASWFALSAVLLGAEVVPCSLEWPDQGLQLRVDARFTEAEQAEDGQTGDSSDPGAATAEEAS
jgi:hypothetical protein